MRPLNNIIQTLIDLRRRGTNITLLAACPNSAAVLEAAVKSAAAHNTIMLFAATLNQVDTDGGYTGWTPLEFVRAMTAYAQKYNWDGPLYACLDHGGPWLKDRHTLDRLTLDETMQRVKDSLAACLEAGYSLLHIDPTVDRSLPPGEPVPLETVVRRTLDLIAHAETVRTQSGLPPVAYEVGTEEVHGGLVDFNRFEQFLRLLRQELERGGLANAWPCFVVAQVGTDLHTTAFDPAAARRLYARLAPLGSLAKGHYTDWVENPADYPASGMGGANVGPEFTSAEVLALKDLEAQEEAVCYYQPGLRPSRFMETLQIAVVGSGRWQKWLQADEKGRDFSALTPARRDWLLQTGARYIWIDPAVVEARAKLYANLGKASADPQAIVVNRIACAMDKYIAQFNLSGSRNLLE